MLVRQLEEELRMRMRAPSIEMQQQMEVLFSENEHLTREIAILRDTIKVSIIYVYSYFIFLFLCITLGLCKQGWIVPWGDNSSRFIIILKLFDNMMINGVKNLEL